jgi:hypothetical protein
MQTFTRKWNAKRHCNTHHEGIFDSIIFFGEYMNVTRTTTKTSPNFPNQNVYPYNNNHLPHQENLFFQDISTSIPSIDPNLLSTQATKDDFTKEEMLLSYILINIVPKYEEIENLLSTTSEPNKKQILGYIVSRAVCDENPFRDINNKLKVLRKTMIYNKMLDSASVFLCFDKQSTKEYLKKKIKEITL